MIPLAFTNVEFQGAAENSQAQGLLCFIALFQCYIYNTPEQAFSSRLKAELHSKHLGAPRIPPSLPLLPLESDYCNNSII